MTRYDEWPNHPLAGVPQEILDVARAVTDEAADVCHDIDPELSWPLADAIVLQLHVAGHLTWAER